MFLILTWLLKISLLKRTELETSFAILVEYFEMERSRYATQKRSFYAHWSTHARQLSSLYSTLFAIYIDRHVPDSELMAGGNGQLAFNALWDTLLNFYNVSIYYRKTAYQILGDFWYYDEFAKNNHLMSNKASF